METLAPIAGMSLSASSETLHGILDALPVAASWALMPGAVIQFTNKAFDRLFGYPPDTFKTADQFVDMVYIHARQRAQARRRWKHFALQKSTGITEVPDMDLEVRRCDGSLRTVRHRGVILYDLRVGLALFEDVTEQKQLQTMLSTMAWHDPLTGLANRRRLDEHWRRATGRPGRRGSTGFLMIDLDGFKSINDTYGHGAGDEVLRTVASRLRNLAREGDTVCRLGGDEFGMLIPGLKRPQQIEALCQRVLATLTEPMTVNDVEVRVGASIGACLYPEQAADLRQMLMRADQALYYAKLAGKGCWRWFAAEAA
ncbi:GGDEF domain-containing protein [Ancylobacter novellus]|uniref:GGDEF domain-containing protein n=1 Tax=Ancylobacter novellus TaxID=921 RepID=UPI0002FD7917|nr:GGDEF domain-containing protein [Ancylobacter novellus]